MNLCRLLGKSRVYKERETEYFLVELLTEDQAGEFNIFYFFTIFNIVFKFRLFSNLSNKNQIF